jgi:hypothetical protein
MTPSIDEESTGAAPGFEQIIGFVGESSRDGHVRVYADLTLSNYCEVRTADVRSQAPLDSSEPDGPSMLTVPADAEIEFVRTDRLAGEANYVAGAIRAMYYGEDGMESATESLKVVGQRFPPAPHITPVLYCVSRVYPPCPSPPKITPDLYCLSRVYPPC